MILLVLVIAPRGPPGLKGLLGHVFGPVPVEVFPLEHLQDPGPVTVASEVVQGVVESGAPGLPGVALEEAEAGVHEPEELLEGLVVPGPEKEGLGDAGFAMGHGPGIVGPADDPVMPQEPSVHALEDVEAAREFGFDHVGGGVYVTEVLHHEFLGVHLPMAEEVAVLEELGGLAGTLREALGDEANVHPGVLEESRLYHGISVSCLRRGSGEAEQVDNTR